MNCLDNLIGIDKTCDTTIPESGLYVNELPGISLRLADAATDEERPSGIKTIENLVKVAQKQISNDIRSKIQHRYRQRTLLDSKKAGELQENLKSISVEAGFYKGIVFDIWRDANLSLDIASIEFIAQSATTTNVYIVDLMQGKIVTTKSITTVADEFVEVRLTDTDVKQFLSGQDVRTQIMVAVDSGVVATRKVTLNSIESCSGCSKRDGYSNKYITMTSHKLPTGGSLTKDQLQSNSDTNGIRVNYSISCNLESFICSMSQQMAFPMWYLIGHLIADEAMKSRNRNSIIIIDKELNEDIRTDYGQKYEAAMETLFGNIVLRDTICFDCRKRVSYATTLPG